MSNIHTLSNLSHSSTSKPANGTQVGNTVYHVQSAGAGLERTMTKATASAQKNIGTLKNLSSIGARLTSAISSGKETEVDRQLNALARMKQRTDVPMHPDIRMAAYTQREAIRPESKQLCPNGHKISLPQAKKQLTDLDVYTCREKMPDGSECGAMCGGEDLHPLHIEIKFLSPTDKNKYLDSVRWLSRNETDVQTRAYIHGHPLVYPHLAEGVLFNDETDAWKGYILGWNIYFWYGNIQKYWERVRKELEDRSADGEDEEMKEDEGGRGKRKKRKLVSEKKREEEMKLQQEEVWEQLPPELMMTSPPTPSPPAAAAASSSSSSTNPTREEQARKKQKLASTAASSSHTPMDESKEERLDIDVDDDDVELLDLPPLRPLTNATIGIPAAVSSSVIVTSPYFSVPSINAAASSAPAGSSSFSNSTVARADPSVLTFPDSVIGQSLAVYSAEFDRIARSLLCDHDLMSNGTRFRVLEIEFYLKYDENKSDPLSTAHHDLFAHGHPVQRNNFGRWYWHRQGPKPDASYKGGSYKGLDVTFGAVSGGGYGGILIRSIQNVKTGEITEGSCLVAEEILKAHQVESIVDLVKTWKGDTSAFTGPTLYFTPSASPIAPKVGTAIMLKSARVGLTLKQSGVTRQQYIMQPYRYTMQVKGACFNKKMKQTILLSVYEELGSSRLSELCTLLGCTRAYADKLIASFQSGKLLPTGLQKFVENSATPLNAEGVAQMYGAWMKLYGTKPYRAIIRA